MTSFSQTTKHGVYLASSHWANPVHDLSTPIRDCGEFLSNPANNPDPAFKLLLYSHLITSSLFGCDGEEPEHNAINSTGDSPAFFFRIVSGADSTLEVPRS